MIKGLENPKMISELGPAPTFQVTSKNVEAKIEDYRVSS